MDHQAMLKRSDIEKCVRSYKHEKSFYFVVAKDLKPKQIENAIKRFAPGVKEQDVVALMDTTLFGSGKEGFLLTATHMYGKYLEGKTVELNRFSKINRKEHYLTVTYPDGKADTLYVSIYDQDLFNLLKLIMDESARLIQAQKDHQKAAADAIREFGKIAQVKLHEVDIKPEEPKPAPKEKPEPKVESIPAREDPGITPTPAFDPIDEPEDPQPQADAEALFQEGRRKFMAKDYAAAVAAFQKAADLGHGQAAQFLKQLKAITGNDT